MKWKLPDFEAAAKNGFANIKGVLLTGQDAGQIDENAGKIISVLKLPKDCIIRCSLTELKSDSDRYFAEACSSSLFGDRRAIVVSDVSALKGDANVLRDLCEAASLSAFVIILAPDLKRDAEIKKFFEGAADFAAMEHYLDTERDLPNIIRSALSETGVIDISRDAMVYMSKNLGVDRGQTRRALEKLAMYVRGKSKVELEDVENCIAGLGSAAMDQLLYSITAGLPGQAAAALDRLLEDKVKPAQIIRALSRHLRTLLAAKSGGQMPVVFWKYRDLSAVGWKIWDAPKLTAMIAKIPEIELALRGSKSEDSVISKFCLDIASYASKLKR